MAASSIRQFAGFLTFGAVSASVNWISRFVYSTAMPFSMAVVCAYLTGMATAFLLFRRYVFPTSPRPIKRQVAWFVVVNIVGLCEVWLISMLLVTIVLPGLGVERHVEAIGHGVALAAPALSSFFGHKYLTYRR